MQKNVYRHSLVGLLLLILCIFPCEGRAQRFDDHKKNSQIVWDNKVLDLKDVDSGKGKIVVEFSFIVKGEVPIIIHNVEASCGCTKVEWSKKPVMPNERSKIVVYFNTKGEKDHFDKSFIVESSSVKSVELLRFKGNIK